MYVRDGNSLRAVIVLQTEACFEPSNIIDKIERDIAKSFELLSKRACALRNSAPW